MPVAPDNPPYLQQEKSVIFDDLKPYPVYYSDKIIYYFTFLFGTLFGCVLMAMNFSKTPEKKGIIPVISFGVLFTAVQILLINSVPTQHSTFTFGLNIIAGQILKHLFWPKYIGKNAAYDKRSFVIPLIVGIVISLGFIMLSFA